MRSVTTTCPERRSVVGAPAHLWSVVAAIAASTVRVGVGSFVANVTTRPAVDIALAAATLQDLSAGRFVLGLGAGASGPDAYAAEMAMFGLAAEPAPRRRVAETIAFLRALWGGAEQFAGEWARFADVRDVAIPDPEPPILVGANRPKMAALAGAHADAVNVHSWQPDLAGVIDTARRAADDAGRTGFAVTVEAPCEPTWLDPDSDERGRLADAQFSRSPPVHVLVVVSPAFRH